MLKVEKARKGKGKEGSLVTRLPGLADNTLVESGVGCKRFDHRLPIDKKSQLPYIQSIKISNSRCFQDLSAVGQADGNTKGGVSNSGTDGYGGVITDLFGHAPAQHQKSIKFAEQSRHDRLRSPLQTCFEA